MPSFCILHILKVPLHLPAGYSFTSTYIGKRSYKSQDYVDITMPSMRQIDTNNGYLGIVECNDWFLYMPVDVVGATPRLAFE